MMPAMAKVQSSTFLQLKHREKMGFAINLTLFPLPTRYQHQLKLAAKLNFI